MNFKLIHSLAIAGICFGFNAGAATTNAPSTYANISIDGSFGDWASVPLAYSQPQLTGDVVQFQNLYIANDNNFLYIQFSLYTSANPFTSKQNLFFDVDHNASTGESEHGIGSEMGIQSGVGFQETNGVFNTGMAISELNWQVASNSAGTDYEMRISLGATFASGAPVFASNTIALYVQSTESSGNEWFPNVSSGGLTYTLATAPVPEPSSWALLAFGGMVAIAEIARRRQNCARAISKKFLE